MNSKENYLIKCACGCGQLRPKYDEQGRERRYIYRHFTKKNFNEKEIIKLYDETDINIRYLAKKYSCDKRTISNLLKRKGIRIIRKPLSKEGINNLVKLRKKEIEEGKSNLMIPKKGISYEEKYGVEKALKIRKKLSISHKGQPSAFKGKTKENYEPLKKISEKQKKNYRKLDYRSYLLSKKALNKKSETMKKSYREGKRVSAFKDLWKNKDFIEIQKRNKKEIMLKFWKNEENKEKRLKNILKAISKRPTSFEQKIILLCSKYRLPFIYTGDGRILIGRKNPDFINEKEKIVIEVFLNYFKIRDYGSVENYIKQRSEYFKDRGYKTIFIGQEEITNKNWEKVCLNKIKEVKNV